MCENAAGKHQQGFEVTREKNWDCSWTASAHIITAVIGSGVLSLAWATAQLGWIAGPAVLFLFSFVTYYTPCLLSACYRSGDSVTGKRNYTCMEAVQNNLGGFQVKVCGMIQYFNLVGVAIGYTIAASISMIAIKRSDCFHEKGHHNPCKVDGTPYMASPWGFKVAGTVWTASAHIITAVIGLGVLSLAWATAQLSWIAGPTVLFLFSFVTYYTSCLLAPCYRSGDSVTGNGVILTWKLFKTILVGFKLNFVA